MVDPSLHMPPLLLWQQENPLECLALAIKGSAMELTYNSLAGTSHMSPVKWKGMGSVILPYAYMYRGSGY